MKFSKPLMFGVLAPLVAWLSGCASYQAGNTQIKDVAQYGNAVTEKGATVAAELYASEAKVKEGFYVNLNEHDFYPVQIVVQNQGAGRLLLLKDEISIRDSSGNEYRPTKAAVMVDAFEHNKVAYALLGFGIFSYMSADDANKKMAADWGAKELASETIINGNRKSSGFVYFKMPKGIRPTGMSLALKVEDMDTKSISNLKLQL